MLEGNIPSNIILILKILPLNIHVHYKIKLSYKYLKEEKAEHAVTREKLVLQEHESKQLRIERHSLKIGLEAANMSINRMEKEEATLKQHIKEQDDFVINDLDETNSERPISKVCMNIFLSFIVKLPSLINDLLQYPWCLQKPFHMQSR